MPEQNSETSADFPKLSAVEFHRIVELSEAARLSSLSADTLKRRYPDKLVRLSPRRLGMRLCDALMLSKTA